MQTSRVTREKTFHIEVPFTTYLEFMEFDKNIEENGDLKKEVGKFC